MVGAVLLVVLLVAGWVALRGYQAERALQEAKAAAVALQRGMLDGTASSADLRKAQQAGARAVAATSDPVWRAVEHVPWVGTQLTAVRVVSVSLDQVTHDVLPPVLDLVGAVRDGSIRTSDGAFDVAKIAAAQPGMDAADPAARHAAEQVAALDPSRLVGALARPVRQAQAQLASIAGSVHSVRTLVDVAPAMLGAGGPRTYLVVALNSAELRAAGGIVGSVIAVHLDAGRASLGAQLTTRDLKVLDQPVLPLTADELALDGDRLGRWVQDASMTPDFPRTGELVAARWVAAEGGTVDGVVSLDVRAVAALLGATGPVTTSSGEKLTNKPFVDAVLRDPYLTDRDPRITDRLFADVAGSVFRTMASGAGDPKSLLHALRTIVDQQRLRVWSAHPVEESVLVPTTVGAAFLTGPHAHDPGVFLNDGSAGKLDYYLTTSLTVSGLECSGPRPTATLRLTLRYDPPKDVASSPLYLQGPGIPGVAPGDVSTSISFYAGSGDQVGPITLDGKSIGGRLVERAGRGTVTVTSVLAPGGTAVYEVAMPVPAGGASVWTTPTLTQGGQVVRACGAVTSTAAATG